MDFMPLFVNLEKKEVLVIGAGKIALRKIKTLLNFGTKVTVVSPFIKEEEIYSLDIVLKKREFNLEDINSKFLVVCATDNEEFNSSIVNLCNKRNILVNNITSKEDLNCRFVVNTSTDKYQIAVSARGYPKKAKKLLEKIKALI